MSRITYHIIITIIISLFFSHAVNAQVNPVRIQAEIGSSANQELTERFYDALINGEYDQVEQMLSPNFMYYASGGDSLDATGMIEMWKGYDETSTDDAVNLFSASMNVPSGAFTGDFVLAWLQASWFDETVQNTVGAWIHEIIQVQDNKIVLIYNYQDNLSIMLQSGFSIQPPSSASSNK